MRPRTVGRERSFADGIVLFNQDGVGVSGPPAESGSSADALRYSDAETCARRASWSGAPYARGAARLLGATAGHGERAQHHRRGRAVQAAVDVPDVLRGAAAAGVKTGVRRKGSRRAALNERPLGGEEAAGRVQTSLRVGLMRFECGEGSILGIGRYCTWRVRASAAKATRTTLMMRKETLSRRNCAFWGFSMSSSRLGPCLPYSTTISGCRSHSSHTVLRTFRPSMLSCVALLGTTGGVVGNGTQHFTPEASRARTCGIPWLCNDSEAGWQRARCTSMNTTPTPFCSPSAETYEAQRQNRLHRGNSFL